MADHASVQTDLVANDAKLQEALKKAGSAIEGYAAKTQSALEGIAKKYLTIGGIASAAMGYLTGSQASAMVETSKLAERLGMAISALQVYQFAAKKAGIGSEEFGMLMGRFQAKMGEAVAGSGPAVKSFSAIGLSIDKLKGMKPEDAFLATIDAIHAIPDQSARAAASMDLFSREGMKMMGIVQQGSGAFDAARAKLQAMGLVFDDVQAKSIRKAVGAMSDLKLSMQAAGQAAAIALAPVIQKVAEEVTFTVIALTKLTEHWSQGTIKAILYGAAIGATIIVISQAVDAIEVLVNALKAVVKSQIVVQAFSGPAGWAMITAGAAAAAFGIAALSQVMGETGGKARETMEQAKKLQSANEQGAAAEKLAAAATKEHGDAIGSQKEKLAALLPPIQRYREEIEKLAAGLQEQAGTVTTPSVVVPHQLTPHEKEGLNEEEARLRRQARTTGPDAMSQFEADKFVAEEMERYKKKWIPAAGHAGGLTVNRDLSPEQQAALAAGIKTAQQSILGIEPSAMETWQTRMDAIAAVLREDATLWEACGVAAKKATEEAFGPDVLTKIEQYNAAVEKLDRIPGLSPEQRARRLQAIENEKFGEVKKKPGQEYLDTMADLAAKGGVDPERQRAALEKSFGAIPQSQLEKLNETLAEIAKIPLVAQGWTAGGWSAEMVESPEAAKYKKAAQEEYKKAIAVARPNPKEREDIFHASSFESAEAMYNRISAAAGGWKENRDADVARDTKEMAGGIKTLVQDGVKIKGGTGGPAVFGA